jgi:NADPH:quinone reductase-like Zn-dependent oxidoreductase
MVVAGEVESVGEAVTRFKPGDQVFAYDITRLNAYAEYACLPETWALALKPSNCSYEEAAAIPFGGVTALSFLRKGQIASGQRALIYGAAGGVGVFAVQLARYFGASVTGVCGPANQQVVKALGANQVIDYTREDFTQNGENYHLIFDTVGKTSLSTSLRSLEPGGVYLQAVGDPATLLRMGWAALTSGKTCIGGTATPTADDLLFLKELVEAGALQPVIDRRYPLQQMAEAHRYVDQGHKRGAVVVTVAIGE